MSRKKPNLIFLIILCIVLFLSTLLLRQYLQSEDARFKAYADELFRQEVTNNTITLHYTLKSPSSYKVYDTPISLGHISTDTDAMGASAENALTRLHLYNRNKLSTENQLIYDLLEHSFSTSKEMSKYALYEEPLSPLTGTQSQLPVLLSEYQFYSTDDVEIYLKLLKKFPDYMQGLIDFETARAEAGLFMSDARVDAIVKECDAFVNMGDQHYLHKTFQNRLKGLNLSKDKYQSYTSENAKYIKKYIYPSYELLKKHLNELQGTGTNENGLCYFPDGKNYYELLVKECTGSNRSIIELKILTMEQISEDLNDMQNALDEFANTPSDSSEIFTDSNPSALLNTLKNKLSGNFPTPPEVDISIKYVDESMEDYLSPAFYLIPAIDNSDENVIYINPPHMTDDLSLFTTLAHEGYPGHLYQTTYFASQDSAPIRSTEGWATYCEMISYYFAPVSNPLATLMQKSSSVMLGLYAYADIGIHYEGWTLPDTIDFFNDYGVNDTDAVREIFNLIIGDPTNYLKYYIGYLEFLELKKDAIKEWGNEFSQERFHREILETGPVPFSLLRKALNL